MTIRKDREKVECKMYSLRTKLNKIQQRCTHPKRSRYIERGSYVDSYGDITERYAEHTCVQCNKYWFETESM